MQIFLRFDSGTNAGRKIRVRSNVFLIGRGEDCHLRPTSELVSRRHCALLTQGETVLIRDFRSSNGTFVNGQRVDGEHPLACEDHLSVGPLQFTLQYESATALPADTPHAAVHKPAHAASPTAAEDVIQSWLADEPPAGRVESASIAVGKRPELAETVSNEAVLTDTTNPGVSWKATTDRHPEQPPATPRLTSAIKTAGHPHADGSSGAAKVAISEFVAKMTKARKDRPQ